MHNTTRAQATGLLDTLGKSLAYHAATQTAAHLGDRSTYVGMSDIGRGLECLRAAVASKLESERPLVSDVSQRLRRQLTLQRGHWQEDGIGAALHNFGLRIIPQLEIETTYRGVPIKAHLDLTLVWGGKTPAVRVLELKSTERLREHLYPSHETQLYGQITLLHALWNKPCFSLRDASGTLTHSRQTFPAIAASLFGISLPDNPDAVNLEGWVVSVGMSDARVFGPYVPDRIMLGVCLQTAEEIWQTAQAVRDGTLSLEAVQFCKGFHPLCDWCDHNAACPKFQDTEAWNTPETEAELHQLVRLKAEKKALESEIDELERRIKATYSEIDPAGGWVMAGNQRFRVSTQAGRETIDRAALTEALLFLCDGDETRVDSVLQSVTKVGAGFERLYVSPVNAKAKPADVKAA